MRTKLIVLALLAALPGCTIVNSANIPSDRSGREIFLTSGDIPEAYTTLGVVQGTRSGVRLFGFIDPAGTDIQTGLRDVLIPEIKKMGGDGAINVRFHQTQYTPWAQALGLVFFFIPLPTSVVVSGEVVKLSR